MRPPDDTTWSEQPVATIKIQRKRPTAWWPVLLLLLVPLTWYLWRGRVADRAMPRSAPPAVAAPATP